MKCLIYVLLLVPFLSFSQEEQKNQLELQCYLFKSNPFSFGISKPPKAVGNGSSFGVFFSRKVSAKLWLSLGCSQLSTTNTYKPAWTNTDGSAAVVSQKTNLLEIPLKLRMDLSKLFFLKSGISYDYQTNYNSGMFTDRQNGFGASFAPGIDFRLVKNLRCMIETEIACSNLFKRSRDKFAFGGLNFNLAYRF